MDITVGDDFIVLNFTISGSGTNITTTRPFRSAYVQLKEDADFTLRRESSGDPFTVKAGSGVVIATKRIPDSGATTTICHATGSGTLEVILTL